MPAARGSKQMLKAVKETVFGTTPTDPVLLELPLVNFNRNFNRNVIRSNQIRSHPFTDRLMKGQLSADFDLSVELQDDTYDVLLDVMFGTTTWAANVIKVTDGLQGISFEASAADLSLHDQFAGGMLTSMEVNFPAEENGIVTANFNGMAKTVSMDAGASFVGAGSVTAAPSVDPFVFQDAVCTIAGASRPITALSLRLEREVNPLYVLGSPTPREYIPSTVTLTGQVTIPLEDATESAQLNGFADIALSAQAASPGGAAFRTFAVPAVKFGRMGRQIQDRGVILQVIDWEARYDSVSGTIMSVTRSA
jgi:hypothetical protein